MSNHNAMVGPAAATIRIITVALLLTDSMRHATAQEGSPPPGILIRLQQPLYAGRSYEVICRSAGWTAAPSMAWWLGDQQQLNAMQQLLVRRTRCFGSQISEDRNESVSILMLTPSPDDNGKTLKCQTEDPFGVEETSVKLQVYHPPIVSLYLETPHRADGIREGDSVSLKCHVQSSPPVWRVKWIFQGRVLQETNSSGALNESLTLRLKYINRRQAGNYSCLVSNAMDDVESPPLQLIVRHRPVCQLQHPVVYSAKLGAHLKLECGGQGVPPAHAYRWMFSRAAYSESQPTQWRTRGPDGEKVTFLEWANGVSWREYQPYTIFDYGTFYCNAQNGLGLQREPCVFHIVPPGRPNAPDNCSVLNETSVAFRVHCRNTRDEGFRQRYVLEVFDAYTGQVKFNKTQKVPNFLLRGFEPNLAVTMRIAAFSPRGRSEWVRMNAVTPAPPPSPPPTKTTPPPPTTTTSATTSTEITVTEDYPD